MAGFISCLLGLRAFQPVLLGDFLFAQFLHAFRDIGGAGDLLPFLGGWHLHTIAWSRFR